LLAPSAGLNFNGIHSGGGVMRVGRRSVLAGGASLGACAGLGLAAADATPLRVPLELDVDIVRLKVRANGSAPLSFILDTGGPRNGLDSDQAARLGLGVDQLTVPGLPYKVGIAKGVTFSLSGVGLPEETVLVLPYSANGLAQSGRRLDGVLSGTLFAAFVVEIDYVARMLTLHDPGGFAYAGPGEAVPIEVVRNQPLVRGKITTNGGDTKELLFYVDSGSFAAANYETDTLPIRRIELSQLDLTSQVTSRVAAVYGRARRLQIGSFVMNDVIVAPMASFALPGSGMPSDMKGLIGGEVLRRFRVIFDYSRKQMILEPNRHFHDPFEFDMSGTVLISDLPRSPGFKIFSVLPGSPASEAGLLAGDVIVAVNGAPASTLDLFTVRGKTLQREGRLVRLVVERQDQRLEARVRLRRLI
jgi:hypothetical protein